MTKKTKQKLDYTLATFAIEGLNPSKEAIKLYKRMDAEKISLTDTLRQIERNHGVDGGKRA